MADTPCAAFLVSKQAGHREEEHTPAPPPQGRAGAINAAQDRFNFWGIRAEIRQPRVGGALVVLAAPAPIRLDGEQMREAVDQPVTWHNAAGEEIARDPVGGVIGVETIGGVRVGKDVQK